MVYKSQDSSSSRMVTSCVAADDLRRAHGVGKWVEREIVLSDGVVDSLLDVSYDATTAATPALLLLLLLWM